MRRIYARVAGVVALALMAGLLARPLAASDYREESLKRIDTLEKKFVGLADAVPADKYTWRPAEGVRSISEVLLHIAAANFGLTNVIGTPPPSGFQGKGYDKSTTDKSKIVAAVKESFTHFRGAVSKLSAADADKALKLFGQETSQRGAVFGLLEHLSEHLGQTIAYARSNGVTPPWSE
jgi:uncharacterized damage-inducible protein DinB